MSNLDEPELFVCFICKLPKPIEQLRELAVKDSWRKRDVCVECLKKIHGISGTSDDGKTDGKTETPSVVNTGRD